MEGHSEWGMLGRGGSLEADFFPYMNPDSPTPPSTCPPSTSETTAQSVALQPPQVDKDSPFWWESPVHGPPHHQALRDSEL